MAAALAVTSCARGPRSSASVTSSATVEMLIAATARPETSRMGAAMLVTPAS